MTTDGDLLTQLADRQRAYRQVRDHVEREIQPRASSVDGVTFELQASAHELRLRRGGYVVLEADDGPRLGQVTDLDLTVETAAVTGLADVGAEVRVQLVRGTGTVLERAGLVTKSRDGQRRHCRISVAPLQDATSWLELYRRHWEEQFDNLGGYLATIHEPSSEGRPDPFEETS